MNPEAENLVCPVCTLFLRPGITLKDHLASHPKIKVIEALVRLSKDNISEVTTEASASSQNNAGPPAGNAYPPPAYGYGQGGGTSQGYAPNCGGVAESVYPTSAPYMSTENTGQNWQTAPSNVQPPMAMNQSIIYQQIMSSNQSGIPQTMVNNLSQQYVAIPVPGMFNPQMNTPMNMMNSNYLYQQQQVIMNCNLPPINPMNMQQNNMQFNQNANSCIIQPQTSRNLRCIEPPPLTPIARSSGGSLIIEPAPAVEEATSRIVAPVIRKTSSRIAERVPAISRNEPRGVAAASPPKPASSVVVAPRKHNTRASEVRPSGSAPAAHPSPQMVLIREANFISPFNYGPYRAIKANPQSGMVIEEIDPLSTTPSSSPTPLQDPSVSLEKTDLDITEHGLSGPGYEEPEVKSPIPLASDEMDITIDEETITPDIQFPQDLRTFCRSPVSEEQPIRAPVITSRSPSGPSPAEGDFSSLDCFSSYRRILQPPDNSLSDPPADPLLLDPCPRTIGGRKCSQDETPLSPASSVGSDFSLRVRKDLQSQQPPHAYDDTSQSAECFSPRGPQEQQPPERNVVGAEAAEPNSARHSNIVLCPKRTSTDAVAETENACVDLSSHPVAADDVATVTNVNDEYGGDALKQSSQPEDALIDMDGMHLMLSSDFMNTQSLISQVDDFECINSNMNQQGSRVLMNIGGMHQDLYTEEKKDEDKDTNEDDTSPMRRDGLVSIQTDERMPPRGELSEAESNGAPDVSWNRIQYQESSSGLSTTYDLFARESWEASDVSDSEAAITVVPAPAPEPKSILPLPSYSPDMDDTPLITDVQEPPLNFKCSTCGKGFSCPKERRAHQTKEHSTKKPRVVKPRLPKVQKAQKAPKAPKARKQPRKKSATAASAPKPSVPIPVKTESNFDNLFSSGSSMKLEDEAKVEIGASETIVQNILLPAPLIEKREEVCEICSMTFSNAKKLKDHLKEAHDIGVKTEYRYTCATCDEKFLNEASYNLHLKVHPLECRICGKFFHRRVNLKLHLKRHMGLKPHKCGTCEKAFITKQKLDEHLNIHTGATPIKCNMCNESFRRHSNLVQHRNRYHLNIKKKIKDFICHCGEIYHSKKKLLWHKETHDLKPKACTYCSEKFVHMSSLTRHMRRAHNQYYVPRKDRETENVQCPVCKGVYLKSSIESHMKTHSAQKLHQCTICNKEFTTKWNLKLHKWTHASRTSKPYKCEQCNGAFIRQTDYIAHMNSHKSIKPYTCNYCGCQFIRKYNCQRHVKEHEEGKSYNCNVCGKTFHRSYYLKEHMRVHTGTRPYSCHICGKTSTTKSNHNKHVRIHHAREPVSTEG